MKELQEVSKFVISLVMAIDKAVADKKINIMDLPLFFSPIMSAQAAFEGIDKVKGELDSMDAAKLAELKNYIKEELDLSSDKSEEIIEKSLDLAIDLFDILKIIKA